MTLLQIIVLVIAALIIGQLTQGRRLVMLAMSAFVVFWLQPAEPFISLMYWLPVTTLAIILLCWALTSTLESRSWKLNWPAATTMVIIVLLMDLNRYFKFDQIITARTPAPAQVLVIIIGSAIIAGILIVFQRASRLFRIAGLIGILLIFILLKSPDLVRWVTNYFVKLHGAGPADASIPLTWLGYSYIAFRLLHTLREKQIGRLPAFTIEEYFNYVIFFPSFTAGPIDRSERFVGELKTPVPLSDKDWVEAGTRLFVGLFKKFVIADLLAIISLSDVLVTQVKSNLWMWLFMYAYSLRIFCDFSGYTDIAIGMGRLMGIQLPENFNAPYLKTNLTQFWNSWHMSLTQWFRSYFFNPLTRVLRSSERSLPVWMIILITQISTMLLIGLWHGITAGFALWGLWHGFGLFIQNRWSEFARPRMPAWAQTQAGLKITNAAGVFLTFNFVSLGWLFFNLSSPAIAWLAIKKLFGVI